MSTTTKTPNNAQQLSIPWGSSATVGRVDQGVDVGQAHPFSALAAGTIVYIDPDFYKGTPAVYERLDQPITVNGRTYTEVYYAETSSLVKVGQHVTPGELVTAGGNAEIGFASGNLPAAHSTYHEGDVTQAGRDFLSAIHQLESGAAVAVGPDLSRAGHAASTAASAAEKAAADAECALNPLCWVEKAIGQVEGWLTGIGKLVLAYVLLVGVAGGLFLTGLKGLGVPTPKPPAVVPV